MASGWEGFSVFVLEKSRFSCGGRFRLDCSTHAFGKPVQIFSCEESRFLVVNSAAGERLQLRFGIQTWSPDLTGTRYVVRILVPRRKSWPKFESRTSCHEGFYYTLRIWARTNTHRVWEPGPRYPPAFRCRFFLLSCHEGPELGFFENPIVSMLNTLQVSLTSFYRRWSYKTNT